MHSSTTQIGQQSNTLNLSISPANIFKPGRLEPEQNCDNQPKPFLNLLQVFREAKSLVKEQQNLSERQERAWRTNRAQLDKSLEEGEGDRKAYVSGGWERPVSFWAWIAFFCSSFSRRDRDCSFFGVCSCDTAGCFFFDGLARCVLLYVCPLSLQS